jgi:hypothetical protein
MRQPGVSTVAILDLETYRRALEREGYAVFVLPPSSDRASFIDAVRATLPLDPAQQSTRSWNALRDSLRDGLLRHPAQRIAILWPGARAMPASDLDVALAVLADVASAPFTRGSLKSLVVIVECGVLEEVVPSDGELLVQFLASYFHQDWDVDAADSDGVVRRFIRDATATSVTAIANALEGFLQRHETSTDAELREELFRNLGCYYVPVEDARDWLSDVLTLLRSAVAC